MDISTSIEIMKSLSDASRLKVINALQTKPQYVEELANRLNLAVSTVSFHLKKLEAVGLVNKVKEQYYVTYHLNETLFNTTIRDLTSFDNIDQFIEEERVKSYRDKVLKTFFKRNKLSKLPVQHKKKMIVLEELLKKFSPGKKYNEENVNEIILEHYDDYCTVRRLFIEEGMMKRENQVYWLNQESK